MSFPIDHDYHIHSYLSQCSSDPEQNIEQLIRYARQNRLHRLCVTDHVWDRAVPGASSWYEPQTIEHIRRLLPLPQVHDVELLFGCETDMDKHGQIGLHPPSFGQFDFIIVPTTHMHMTGFTIPTEATSAEARAALWVERFDTLLNSDLPMKKTGLAHPVCVCMCPSDRSLYLRILELLPTEEMERLFSRAAEVGLGIEINADDMRFSDVEAATVLRPLHIAKSCGCKFYLGSDAHRPKEFTWAMDAFRNAIHRLDLRESDVFVPQR